MWVKCCGTCITFRNFYGELKGVQASGIRPQEVRTKQDPMQWGHKDAQVVGPGGECEGGTAQAQTA